MAFTPEQQQQRRQAFIDERHQKAWGAACHADWIGSQLDKLVSDYGKLKAVAHLCLGRVQIHTNRAAQGIAECERALALDRNLATAHAIIGFGKMVRFRQDGYGSC